MDSSKPQKLAPQPEALQKTPHGELVIAHASSSLDEGQDAANKSPTEDDINNGAKKALEMIFGLILCPEVIKDPKAMLTMSAQLLVGEASEGLSRDQRIVMYCATKEFEAGKHFDLVDFVYGDRSSKADEIQFRCVEVCRRRMEMNEVMKLFEDALVIRTPPLGILLTHLIDFC
jgi:hypothetical protein